jgi:hypothetical protein
MSPNADLLRRAAAMLRWHVDAATEQAAPGVPWSAERSGGGIYLLADRPEVPTTTYLGDMLDTDIAKYCALMHPPVALALAVVFDRFADAHDELMSLANKAQASEPRLAHLADTMEVVRLAREVLREPKDGAS